MNRTEIREARGGSALDQHRVARGAGQIAGNYFMANGRVMHLRIINSAMERICADPLPPIWSIPTFRLIGHPIVVTLLRIYPRPKFPLFQIFSRHLVLDVDERLKQNKMWEYDFNTSSNYYKLLRSINIRSERPWKTSAPTSWYINLSTIVSSLFSLLVSIFLFS